MSGFDLEQPLPTRMWNNSKLVEFYLWDSHVTGDLSETIGNITSLERLCVFFFVKLLKFQRCV